MSDPLHNPEKPLPRTPPASVRRFLRTEVGFGCPVGDCSSPFLEYHHFDPEWSVERHHRPDGMIALCPDHHRRAVGFTNEQLHALKASSDTREISGRFEWMRKRLVAFVGGCLYIDCPVPLQFGDEPMLWFERDDEGYALLNFRMLTEASTRHERTKVLNNDFFVNGTPSDLTCPTHGRLIDVRYENGDQVRIEFVDVASMSDPAAERLGVQWALPQLSDEDTIVAITFVGANGSVKLTPKTTNLPGGSFSRGVFESGRVGISFTL